MSGLPREDPERIAQVRDARQIAPMEIFQHEQERPHGALGSDPFAERSPEPHPHDLRIVARRTKLGARALARRSADELREKLGDARRVVPPADAGHVTSYPRVLVPRIALAQPDGMAHELSDEGERRSGADLVRSRGEDLGVATGEHPRDELVPQT